MGAPKYVNTKAAGVVIFGSLATSATALTFTQLPSVVCDEVVLSLQPAGTPANIAVAGVSSPGTNYIILPTGFPTITLKTGGNLNNLWVANITGVAAQAVGYQTLQYLPLLF